MCRFFTHRLTYRDKGHLDTVWADLNVKHLVHTWIQVK